MAIVNITTTHKAVPLEARSRLAAALATLTYEAEGFGGSTVAPTLSWTFFDEQPSRAFSTGAGDPVAALYYVRVTILAGVMDRSAKQKLGAGITSALLAQEGSPPTPENRNRIWVRFMDVADGDLIVGGEATSLASLKALVAQARHVSPQHESSTMSNIITDPTAFPFEFETALNQGDLERIVALYDEEAAIRVQSNEIHSGSVAVRAEMQQLISAKANIENTLRHTLRRGDTALIIVDYVLRLTAPDGTPVSVTGTATNVLRHHPEKGWRMIIANPQGTA